MTNRTSPDGTRGSQSPVDKVASLFRALALSATCGITYFVVLSVFLSVPAFNGVTQIRPASGMAPTLGLLFGFPAVLGCSIANLVSDFIRWPNDPFLFYYFLVQIVYGLGLRTLWRLVFPDEKTAEFKTSRHIAVFLAGALLDSLLVTALLMPVELETMPALNIHAVHLLNNFLALVYVGIPIIVFSSRMRSADRGRGLSERFALAALATAAIVSIITVAFIIVFFNAWKTQNVGFDQLVAQVYLILSFITAFLFGLACALLRMLERSLTAPLQELAADARTLAQRIRDAGPEQMRDGALDVRLSQRYALEEIVSVARESNEMRHALGSSMIESQKAARERERISTELALASTIQSSALPTDFSALMQSYCLSIEAVMKPARMVGGDFYDVFPLDARRLCALIADVSDKGVPASLFMMRAMAETRECLKSSSSLGEGLSHASSHLCANNDASLFVTMFAIALDTVTGKIEYANAGHNPPLLRSEVHGDRWIQANPGLPLGVLDDYYYESGSLTLLPGEEIVLYTDGVTEARSSSGELFGGDRLRTALASNTHPPTSTIKLIGDAVAAFSKGSEQADDLTIFSMRWLPNIACKHFDADRTLCIEAQAFIRSQLSAAFPGNAAFDLDIIVEELFVNIAVHAYCDLPDARHRGIDLYVAEDSFNQMVHIMLQDGGIAYDPTSQKVETLERPQNPTVLQPGGMGLLLAQRLSDSMQYERVDGCNLLHIVKSYGL